MGNLEIKPLAVLKAATHLNPPTRNANLTARANGRLDLAPMAVL